MIPHGKLFAASVLKLPQNMFPGCFDIGPSSKTSHWEHHELICGLSLAAPMPQKPFLCHNFFRCCLFNVFSHDLNCDLGLLWSRSGPTASPPNPHVSRWVAWKQPLLLLCWHWPSTKEFKESSRSKPFRDGKAGSSDGWTHLRGHKRSQPPGQLLETKLLVARWKEIKQLWSS